ncbi:MAG: nucleotidyl transferase AbiEii/AbiGii toxin family protein [Anaerolineales bacterium]|nr:nucleotidyl transferase AbiEii/AbiGii toxin family protein [Anaerolineales bacterium]
MATIIQTLLNVLNNLDYPLANETKRIHLMEALQSLVLDFIYNHPLYRGLNFYGGTCLHIIYNLNRLSEDIDLDNSQGIGLDLFRDDLLDYFQKHWSYQEISVRRQESETGIIRLTLRFPVLYELGLSPHRDEMLHLKVEISQHPQSAIIQQTPVIHFGRSFVPSHFSLETMMAGKMLACLERSFQIGGTGIAIKGRDFYDLLWFMQQRIHPLGQKLERDGVDSYTVQSAMLALQKKVERIKRRDLEIDLLPLFEQRTFIEAWIMSFHTNFKEFLQFYISL